MVICLNWHRTKLQAKVEHQKASISALQKLRGKDADITQETAEIQVCAVTMIA